MKFIPTLLLFFLFTTQNIIYAQHCKSSQKETFHVDKPKKVILKVGQPFSLAMHMRSPRKAQEVVEADFITCSEKLFGKAKVNSFQIKELKDLPRGLNWKCDNGDCMYTTGQQGCITIQGTPMEKGTFYVVAYIDGVGSYLGIYDDVSCMIEPIVITVE